MGRVQGKVAVITGAGSGIGRASAILLAKEGAKVVLTDVRADKLTAVTEEIAVSHVLNTGRRGLGCCG
ncbi:SDR family NAD(P)-dependent oxidoreductase [Cohnella herbarum]|uniref:SDR family NAD(P)-dependent oxidoreductase n=1 Tax=Cohnella herbarum TaxID=2728023 RepID=A0A7Z2VL86_9BACL|nr:SDR family NAD(P)-dependent oxidoreductase [Cohnella herbarum]QJD85030.1 SDR family NAD(P)-dependent oxidoreductase [Cohnella herbarum]